MLHHCRLASPHEPALPADDPIVQLAIPFVANLQVS
jgi:hypothetical protein